MRSWGILQASGVRALSAVAALLALLLAWPAAAQVQCVGGGCGGATADPLTLGDIVGTTSSCSVGAPDAANSVCLGSNAITGEGSTADTSETVLAFGDATADQTLTCTGAASSLGCVVASPAVPTNGATAGNSLALTASPAIPNAGAGTDGAAAGGSVTITAGAAARDTSGDANGGNISLVAGAGVGTGRVGQILVGSATTSDTTADAMIGASATAAKGLVIQAKATPTQPPFQVQQSTGTPWFTVGTDGNVIIDQRTSSTYTYMLDVKYQGTQQFGVNSSGNAVARVGFNGGGGYFTTDGSGNVTGLGTGSFKHLLSNGTSPTVAGSCGSSPTIAGKDSAMSITTGSGSPTSCTATFGTAWATAPVCTANATTTTTPLNITTSTTTVVVSAAALTAGEVLHVVCVGF